MLHSGGFGDETYARELLESAAAWPADFVLVIHTKYRPGRRDTYLDMAREAALPNVILSTEPLPPEEYERMVASADLGLVLYKTIPGSLFRQKEYRVPRPLLGEVLPLHQARLAGRLDRSGDLRRPAPRVRVRREPDLLRRVAGSVVADSREARVALGGGEASLCREARFRRSLAHDRFTPTGGDGVDMLRVPSQPRQSVREPRTQIEEVRAGGRLLALSVTEPVDPDRTHFVTDDALRCRSGSSSIRRTER